MGLGFLIEGYYAHLGLFFSDERFPFIFLLNLIPRIYFLNKVWVEFNPNNLKLQYF